MKANEKLVFGVDIGGVIIDRANDDTDTSFFGPNYLESTAVAGAFESLQMLVQAGFCIFLVSKCGEKIEGKTRKWLAHHSFFSATGIPDANLRFCRRREDKAEICTSIGATHFVDDRLEVLSYLKDVPRLFLLNQQEKEVAKFAHIDLEVQAVATWGELCSTLGIGNYASSV